MELAELNEFLDIARKDRILDLSDENLTEENIQTVSKAIPDINGLVTINFSGIEGCLTKSTSMQLFAALKKCENLLYLNMNLCGLNNEDIKYLVAAVEDHPSLLALELRDNSISYEGILELAKMLQNNKKLLSLDLSQNEIGISARKIILKAIRNNNTLLWLNIFTTKLKINGIDQATEIKIDEKISVNINLFCQEVIFKNKVNFITDIPSMLTDYIEDLFLMSSFAEKPIKLEDNPIIFIGRWQCQSQTTTIELNKATLNTLTMYTEKNKDILLEIEENKENVPPMSNKIDFTS